MLLAVDGMDSWFPRNASVGQRWRSAVSGPSCARLLPLLLPGRRLSWRYAGLKLSYSFATSLQVYDSQACGRSAVIQDAIVCRPAWGCWAPAPGERSGMPIPAVVAAASPAGALWLW